MRNARALTLSDLACGTPSVRVKQGIALAGGVVFSLLVAYALATRGAAPGVALVGIAAAVAVGLRILERPHVGLGLAALLLTFAPIYRFEVGGLPLYVLDAVIAATLVGVLRAGCRLESTGRMVVVYLLLWLPALGVQIARIGIPLEPTYGFVRNVLAVSAFFLGWGLAIDLRARRVRTIALAGVIATCLLAIAQAVPGLSSVARTVITAAAPDLAPGAYRTYPRRAFALFQAPTTLSVFLAALLPILAVVVQTKARADRLPAATLLLVGGALVATYSRQWVPATVVGLVVLGAAQPRQLGRIAGGAAVAAVFVWLLLALGLLDADYLGQRFGSLSRGTEDRNVAGRLQTQHNFLRFAVDDPLTVLTGNGFATQDLVQRGLVTGDQAVAIRAGYSDNAFLLEIWNHGLPAGVMYVVILIRVLRRGFRRARAPGSGATIRVGLTASLATMLTLHLFDNTFSESLFLKALLWLVVGWLVRETELSDEPALSPAESLSAHPSVTPWRIPPWQRDDDEVGDVDDDPRPAQEEPAAGR